MLFQQVYSLGIKLVLNIYLKIHAQDILTEDEYANYSSFQ